MSLFEKILMVADSPRNATTVLAGAKGLVNRLRSEVIVLDCQPHRSDAAVAHRPTRTDSLRAETWTRELIEAGATVVEVVRVIGSPAALIEELAVKGEVSLVVLGNETAGTEVQAWFGTPVQRLAKRIQIPILVTHGTQPIKLESMVVLVDYSNASRRALHHATALAQATEAKLHLISVVSEPPSAPFSDSSIWSNRRAIPVVATQKDPQPGRNLVEGTVATFENERRLDKARRELELFVADFDFSDISVESHVTSGLAFAEVMTLARAQQADLIIAGSAWESGIIPASSQTTAEALAELAETPVMIFQTRPHTPARVKEVSISASQYV